MNPLGIPGSGPGRRSEITRRWSRRLAAATGLAMLPGLLTPIAFGASRGLSGSS
jgi:hypothetical protein